MIHFVVLLFFNNKQLDILIVGGGAVGFWVLNKFAKLGYSVVLITDSPLGNGQTFDSQVYKHRGHFYNNVEIEEIVTYLESKTEEQVNKFVRKLKEMRSELK